MFNIFLLLIFICTGCGPTYTITPPDVERKAKTDSSASVDPTKPQEPHTCDAEDIVFVSNNKDFSHRWGYCARDTWGDRVETTNCLREPYSKVLSQSCGSCFGNFAACGASNCKAACFWDSKSVGCKRCGWNNCGNTLDRCIGDKEGKIDGERARTVLAEYCIGDTCYERKPPVKK